MIVTKEQDYYSNHSLKLRFPWSLYHGPIIESLRGAIQKCQGRDVLNLGSGPFHELELLDGRGKRFTLCDVDPRAMQEARARWGSALGGADVIDVGRPLPYADATFDLVVSMDVIEHVLTPVAWTREALRVLKPDGRLFLTTPNYASWSLRVIENTALEAIARFQGFSRRHIHPTKMTPEVLRKTLAQAGANDIETKTVAFGWVLTAEASPPSPVN